MHGNVSFAIRKAEISPVPEIVCWSRMQSEAGQALQDIVARKELERAAGNGLFFWGVGNAPSKALSTYGGLGKDIDVVFSTMKSRAKSRDAAPSGITVWRRFVDAYGVERPLPPNSLVTSRTTDSGDNKKVHYALVCWSDAPLHLSDHGPFDHTAYRNASSAGGAVGASQVTALLRRVEVSFAKTTYQVNLKAKLRYDYWVKLSDPLRLTPAKLKLLAEAKADALSVRNWLELVAKIRRGRARKAGTMMQHNLF